MRSEKKSIGIPKETKPAETRVALVPAQVKLLVAKGYPVLVQTQAGVLSGFPDAMYAHAGAQIVSAEEALSADVVLRLKRPPVDTIKPGQIIGGYFHIENNRDPELLNALIQRKCTALIYHLMFDKFGKRLVTLGEEGGIVGTYESLRLYGALQKQPHLFKNLPDSWECGSREAMITAFNLAAKKKSITPPKIYILGNGVVARGARGLLNDLGLPYFVLGREQTKHIETYLSKADIIINTVYWKKGDPHIITRDMLRLIKPTTPIMDISCDEAGSIETTHVMSWANPRYKVDGITHFAVSNLGAAIGHTASSHFSAQIFPFLEDFIAGKQIPGLIIQNGKQLFTNPSFRPWLEE